VSNANDYSPVGLDTVLGVAASDAYDRVINWGPGSGSNWGTEVDITAPGIDVDVLNNDGTIVTTSGTSLAAAVVSGAAAQFIVENPTHTAQQIQTEIITKAGMDLLFRNESVYGTTPNVLLRIPFYGDVFEGTPSSAEAKKGQTTRVAITAHTAVATITIDDIVINNTQRPPYSWVSFDSESRELIFSPNIDVPTAKYVVMYAGKNANAELISNGVIVVEVFNVSPTEIINNETYFNIVENGVVVVKPAACVSYVSCPNGTECFDNGKGGFCVCSGGSCVDS
jgi:subtilisin family serine protease